MTVERDRDGGDQMRLQCDDCSDLLDEDFAKVEFNAMIDYAKGQGWTIRKVDHHFDHWCQNCKPTGLAAQKALFNS